MCIGFLQDEKSELIFLCDLSFSFFGFWINPFDFIYSFFGGGSSPNGFILHFCLGGFKTNTVAAHQNISFLCALNYKVNFWKVFELFSKTHQITNFIYLKWVGGGKLPIWEILWNYENKTKKHEMIWQWGQWLTSKKTQLYLDHTIFLYLVY